MLLAGLLFADQGAEVLVIDPKEGADVDSYLNRSKIACSHADLTPSSADIIIVDGDDAVERLPHQIVLRTCAALPGDERFGHLPHDVDEDYLSALTGFFNLKLFFDFLTYKRAGSPEGESAALPCEWLTVRAARPGGVELTA